MAAQTYKFCNGNTTVNTTVNMSLSTLKWRQYTIGDTVVTESYYTATFTCSVAPIENGLRVFYSFEFRYRYNYDAYSSWYTQASLATIPVGQNSVTKDIPVTRNYCFTSGDGDETIRYSEMQ